MPKMGLLSALLTDPREWLNRVRGNLSRAKVLVPGGYLEDLCFDAQQSAEKAIKAVMIRSTRIRLVPL